MPLSDDDFISQYLSYVGITECPTFYHRWCCISMIGALLGRQYNTNLGRFPIYPNHYCMLIGVSAARKSTAIKTAKEVLSLTGYNTFSGSKTSKEKFMLDLLGDTDTGAVGDSILDSNLWGADTGKDCEMFIACDEFNDFIGDGNIEFISLLGNLWDFNGIFQNRIKTGKSVDINNPTISILGGNTPVNFARAFPPQVLGQGFFSRLLLIYGEETGRKIAWPTEPGVGETNEIVTRLQQIKGMVAGKAEKSQTVNNLLAEIYNTWKGMDDVRFSSYCGRRFTHLLKLCLITSASRGVSAIEEIDVIYANTILAHTEFLMPKALGEFGKSRNSDTTHKVMQILESASKPLPIRDLWKELHTELERINDLAEIINNLILADKIFGTELGYVAKRKVLERVNDGMVDFGMLTEEERNMVK